MPDNKYNLYQKNPDGYLFIATVQENIEDDEVYAVYKDGTAKVYRSADFYGFYNKSFFILAERPDINRLQIN